MIAPRDFGACYSCRHWTYRAGDERHREVMLGQDPREGQLGDCAEWGDVMLGSDTCRGYERRRDEA